MAGAENPPETSSSSHAEVLPTLRVIAIGNGCAAILALSVSAQTYLSMLNHGHSFVRILAWQLGSWGFWGFAAPVVLRSGAAFATEPRTTWRNIFRLMLLWLVLMAAHGVVASYLTLLLQPLVPVVTYNFTAAFSGQLPVQFATDLLVYVLLLVGGGTFSVRHRARRLELSESRLETELVRAQLHALRLEIEPHFLFNTLNAIAALIRLKDNRRALEMLVGLSDFMRSAVDGPRDQLVPLSGEIGWIRRYVGLQQTRFGDRLEVVYSIQDACTDVLVPTLLLQPLVENALRHGAARQSRICRVTVGADLEEGGLRLWVADDGVGLRPGFDLGRDAGTGLGNTRSRLHQLYGQAATLDVRGNERGGTIVELTLPAVTAVPPQKATA
jgi:hypothetical protein